MIQLKAICQDKLIPIRTAGETGIRNEAYLILCWNDMFSGDLDS